MQWEKGYRKRFCSFMSRPAVPVFSRCWSRERFLFVVVPPCLVGISRAVDHRGSRNDEGEQPVLGGLLRSHPVRKSIKETEQKKAK